MQLHIKLVLDEWLQVRSEINPDAVHLWRGK
jgi:hypothetical protein